MDDLGSDQICKLSCNKQQQQKQKTNNSAIYDYNNTATSTTINESTSGTVATIAAAVTTAATINNTITTATTKSSPIIAGNYDRFDMRTMMMMKPDNKKSSEDDCDQMYKNSSNSNSITPISSSGNDSSPEQQNQQQQQQHQMMMEATAASATLITGYGGGDEDSDEKEKTDVTPENVKKLDDVILASCSSGRISYDRNKNENNKNNNEICTGKNSKRRIEMKSAGVRDGNSSRDYDKSGGDGYDGNGGCGGGGGDGGGDDDDDDDDNIELKIVEDESPTKQNLAFTIEFSEGESSATAARYKNMVERFQNRHRRGASLSKLEDNHSSNSPIGTPPIVGRTSRVMSAVHQRQQKSSGSGVQSSGTNQDSEANKVKLRIRERSTSGIRDASKRHSWSPRSSTHEPFMNESQQHQQHLKQISRDKHQISKATGGNMMSNKESAVNFQRQTVTKQSDKLNSKTMKRTDLIPASPHLEDNTKMTKTFTPRSTALQLALNKVEFLCPEPPLDNFSKNKNIGGDDDCESVSEAGTYTVDGDNYTEEQKEQMNIDKSVANFSDQLSDLKIDSGQQIRPSELSLHTTNNNIENQRRNNILEINYYHDSTSLKPKISYLEKIKSKVRSIAKSPDKKLNSPSDVGVFTSVTTSGVLSIKPTLDSHPKANRRNSLTKSHVDSSEYISTDSNFKRCSGSNTAAEQSPYSSTFTDHQKAEYKLNLFSATTNQTDSQILNENYSDIGTPITPDSPTNSFSKSITSETGLKTAQSKNDWIQEWARNARARSQSATTTSSKVSNEQMSRSYNFEAVDSVGFDESSASAMYHNKAVIDRLRSHGIGNFEYSSDPNVSSIKNASTTSNCNNGNGNVLSTRPPMSPSKIPSPMHSIGRARSASRTRGSLQDLSPSKTATAAFTDSTDIYLQKTAAAISNLTQSFSRKNSLQSTVTAATKSPPLSSTGNSPRHHIFPQHYSADEYSPTHTRHHYSNHHSGHNQHHSNVHKRNLSLDCRNNLMSHSLNTETLTTILGNEKQRANQSNRSRQHSYDGAGYESPKLFQRKAHIDQTTGCLSSTKQSQPQPQHQQQSPIRRSSSFSTRPMSTSSSGRQQQQTLSNNQNIKKNTGVGQNSIQKSASSTSFRKMYSDYDDSIAYYINDEDDLIDAEYCPSSDDYDDSDHGECYVPPIPATEPEPSEPLTNTRYNKALLMRIERSKQRVANLQGKPSGGGGVMACPNTPEMPRRAVQSAGVRPSIRQSVPRDSSLSRLKAEVPNSLASAKKHLLQTVASTPTTGTSTASVSANTGKRVQPKYMDISKYKPVQGANFLRKDETKSTLINTRSTEIKRSPSSASVTLNRTDPTRASNRSVKSASSRSGCGSKREPSVSKQKEVELAMWKRRATYDPMKSAAEDRKRKEEAKRLAQSQAKSSESSIVARSQSFHSGVTLMSSSKLQFHHNHSNFRNSGSNDDDDHDDDGVNDDDDDYELNDYDQDNTGLNNRRINNYRWTSTDSNNKIDKNKIRRIQGINDYEEDEN